MPLLLLAAGFFSLLLHAPFAQAQEVTSDDLMNAMRQSLGKSAAPAPPAAQQPAFEPAPEPRVVPTAKPKPAPRPAPEVAKKEPEPKPVAREEPAILPPPKPMAPADAAPAKEAAKPATPPPAVAAPATTSDSSGAPLLSDMQEPPNVLTGGPAAEPGSGQKIAAPAGGNFSPARPLFSKKGGKKRDNVTQNAAMEAPAMTAAAAPPPPPSPEPAKAPAPPVAAKSEAAPPAPEPASAPAAPKEVKMEVSKTSPNTLSGGSRTVPAPGDTEGVIIYSQKAGEPSPPVLTATEPPEAREFTLDEAEPVPPPAAAPAEKAPAPPPAPTSQAEEPKTISSVINKALRGSCGAANGVGTATEPTGNLCSEGAASEVKGKGPWTWNCTGEKGSVSNCSAPMMLNGVCGVANGSQLASAPLAAQLCRSGKSNDLTGSGPWHWNCIGSNGGGSAQCAAYTLVSGACGPANKAPIGSIPNVGLCASGKASEVAGEGPWTWNCVGSGEGTTTSCSAPRARNGECGMANNAGALEKPSVNLCAFGKASPVTGKGPWNWNCLGESGGTPATCGAILMTNGVCGASSSKGMTSAPQNGLCASGTPSEVAGNGPWSWSCTGTNGGAKSDCLTQVTQNGECGAANREETDMAPAEDLCNVGTASAVGGKGPWSWSCQGAYGGGSATCMAPKLMASACGAAHGIGTQQPPSSNLCASGTATQVSGSGPWGWSCQDNKGNPVNCMAPLMVNAACGASSETALSAPPEYDLCRNGMASPVTGKGPWSWTCQGAGGGMSVTCRAEFSENGERRAASAADEDSTVMEATGDCSPGTKRWTISCQKGGYPANFTGNIVGETQTLCPSGVERDVWLSNSCVGGGRSSAKTAAAEQPSFGELLPEMEPLSSQHLKPPAKGQKTKGGGAAMPPPPSMAAVPVLMPPRFKGMPLPGSSIPFPPDSEVLEVSAATQLDSIVTILKNNNASTVTLNAYAMPKGSDTQEARRIALARALAVRGYMMSRGIANSRIDIRALGNAGDSLGDDRVDIKVAN